MKKILYLFGAMAFAGLMASCSSDDPDVPSYPANTFTDANGLTLTVNEAPMLGKSVNYAQNGSKATLTLSSSIDFTKLDELEGITIPGLSVVPCPSGIPGSQEITLNVDLKEGTGCNTFSGKEETAYCTFKYDGTVSEEALVLNITDLELKDKSLVGNWNVPEHKVVDDWTSEDYGKVLSTPISVVWKSEKGLNLFGTEMPIEDILTLVMALPLLQNNTATLPVALSNVLKQLQFQKDGNILAQYVDAENLATGTVLTSPTNLIQYTVTDASNLLLFLNPQAIEAADDANRLAPRKRAITDIPGIDSLIPNVLAQLVPMMGGGVPMQYELNGNDMRLYLGTDVLLPLLKQISPLLKNEQIINTIVEMASQNENMAGMATMLPDILKSAADVIDTTTQIEIGLNLNK